MLALLVLALQAHATDDVILRGVVTVRGRDTSHAYVVQLAERTSARVGPGVSALAVLASQGFAVGFGLPEGSYKLSIDCADGEERSLSLTTSEVTEGRAAWPGLPGQVASAVGRGLAIAADRACATPE